MVILEYDFRERKQAATRKKQMMKSNEGIKWVRLRGFECLVSLLQKYSGFEEDETQNEVWMDEVIKGSRLLIRLKGKWYRKNKNGEACDDVLIRMLGSILNGSTARLGWPTPNS